MRAYFDTETELMRTGIMAPPLVCISTKFEGEAGPSLHHVRDPNIVGVVDRILSADQIIGFNTAFDMAILAANFPQFWKRIWKLYEEGRVFDGMIRWMLRAICLDGMRFDEELRRKPKFSLAEGADKFLGLDHYEGKKAGAWRYRYSELIDIPIPDWPEFDSPTGPRQYSLDDATDTEGVWLAMEDDVPPDEQLQVRAHWALHLAGCRGMRVDQDAVKVLRDHLTGIVKRHEQPLLDAGILYPKKNGKLSKSIATIQQYVKDAYEALDFAVPRNKPTPKMLEKNPDHPGNIKYDSKSTLPFLTAKALNTLDDTAETPLEHLLAQGTARHELDSFLPSLDRPVVHPVFNIVVVSGRTSCRKGDWGMQTQNPPRRPGVRECLVPRKGFVFIDADYHIFELCTLAEICKEWLGYSRLGDIIRKGIDPHLYTGAMLAGVEYDVIKRAYDLKEPWAKKYRQMAKPINFGFPGGMGIKRFISSALEEYGVVFTWAEAEHAKRVWLQTYPEMVEYFKFVSAKGEPHFVIALRTGGIRGGVGFCDGCNTPFQRLAADAAKLALWATSKECYLPGTDLYGSFIVNFVHDQIVCETPAEKAEKALARLEEVMITEASKLIWSVPIKTDGQIHAERWKK